MGYILLFQVYFRLKHQQPYLYFQWFSQKKKREKSEKIKTLKVSGNKMWKFINWICGEKKPKNNCAQSMKSLFFKKKIKKQNYVSLKWI